MSKGASSAKPGPENPGRPARVSPVQAAVVRDQAPDAEMLHEAAETFSMLASPTRLHLLWLLSRREHDVGSLADAVQASDALVSQHLSKLRLADLVSARRQGKRQIYVVDDDHVVSLIEQAFDHHAGKRR
jgi:DNA-binding transcriptional ArsR family regulator